MKSKAKILFVPVAIVSFGLAACAGLQPAPTPVLPTSTPLSPDQHPISGTSARGVPLSLVVIQIHSLRKPLR